MSSHHGKLLELLAIDDKSHYPFLRIKLSFPEDMEIIWKIDEYTAGQLRPIAQFDKKYKYRLSLNSSWDGIKKQHISTLTRTYLNTSNRVYFLCSENYVAQLSSIKHSQGIYNLDTLYFTPKPLEIASEYERPKRSFIFVYVFFLIICFLLSLLLSYSTLPYLSKLL